MQRKRKGTLVKVLLLIVTCFLIMSCKENNPITLEMLLDEMVSCEANTLFPDYKCFQQSSYDRRSITPDNRNWFANDDGSGYIRKDTIDGRTEKVLFEAEGPGVITRIWTTTQDRKGTLRFYFDAMKTPTFVIPAYDMMRFGIPLGLGLCQPHINNEPKGKGGSTFYLPIPFAKSCKITLEEPAPDFSTPRYYQINWRKYSKPTKIETFSNEVANRAADKIIEINDLLLNPPIFIEGSLSENTLTVKPSDVLTVELPNGQHIVKTLRIKISDFPDSSYSTVMRSLIITGHFDGKETVRAPLSDFSGAGLGAYFVNSWFLTADGSGEIIFQYPMPYRQNASISIINKSSEQVKICLLVNTDDYEWKSNSLYFNVTWKEEKDIPVTPKWENCKEWIFAHLTGRGIYKGDVLTLYNHSPKWYGEGDEKIYVDNEPFPSHFGTGTEDYYNCSWAPVKPFHTPFGGAPRADNESSEGYNTFFRLRCLDGIPFNENLRFNFEMMSWEEGLVDYASTVFWYGNN